MKSIATDASGGFDVVLTKFDELGDMATAIPAIKLLRAAWPQARLTMICFRSRSEVLAPHGLINEFVRIDDDFPMKDKEAFFLEVDRHIKGKEFQVGIDLRHDANTRWLLLRLNICFRAGFSSYRTSFGLDVELPEFERSLRNLGGRAIKNHVRLQLLAQACVSAFSIESERQRSLPHAKRALIAPGSLNPIKQWPVEYWSQLCKKFYQHDYSISLVGIEDDANFCADIVAKAKLSSVITNLAGKTTVTELLNLVSSATIVIGLDSGVTHIAAQQNVPSVTIFSGYTDHRIWGPDNVNSVTIVCKLPCAPCRLANLEDCWYGHQCMTSIEADMVFAAAQQLENQNCQVIENGAINSI
jgi:ADP-heptose:LPS heptosyltransferase